MTPSTHEPISAKVHFLTRDLKYQHEKPYTLRYASTDVPQTNIERVEHSLDFHDMRSSPSLAYEKCGFMVTECPGKMEYDDYADTEKIEGVHGPQVIEAVKEALSASYVHLLDYVVRRRHPTWPIATGDAYEFNQPASRAHVDHTLEGCRTIIRDTLGGSAAEKVLSGKWQMVNAWHPLRGPLIDWPLAVCDAESVDFAADSMAGDVVDRTSVFENTQIHYNPNQKWYYLSEQKPSELIIFKNGDGDEPLGATPGVPHASFDNPLKSSEDFLRESIEMRLLVTWGH